MSVSGELTEVRSISSVRETNPPLIKTEPVQTGIDDICTSSAEEQINTDCKTKLKVIKNEIENVLIGKLKHEPVEVSIDETGKSSVQEEIDAKCKIKLKVLNDAAENILIIPSITKTEPVEIGIEDIWNSSDEDDISTILKRQQNLFNHETENVSINNIIESKEDCNNKLNEVEGKNTNHEDISIMDNLAPDEQLVVNYSSNLKSIQDNTSDKSIGEDQINWAFAYKTWDPDWKEESKKVIQYLPPKITQKIAPHEFTTLTPNKHVCNHCQYASKDIKEVRRHIRTKHREDVARYQCPYCPYKPKVQNESLRSHIIAKHKDEKDIRWFKCHLCDMKFKLKVRVSNHIRRVHFPVIDWQACPICEKEYKNTVCLKLHIDSVHKKKWKNKLHCKECEFSGQDRMALDHHVEVCHTNSDQLPTLKCIHCDYQTKYKLRFQRHSKLHKTSLSCEECGFSATNGERLRLHQMTHKSQIDESDLKYRCTKCDYKTYRMYSFNVHKLNHLEPHEIQYFYCYHCDFKAKRKDNLKKHVFKHFKKDEVTFQCFICDFLTKKRDLLITHINEHSEAQNQDQVYS